MVDGEIKFLHFSYPSCLTMINVLWFSKGLQVSVVRPYFKCGSSLEVMSPFFQHHHYGQHFSIFRMVVPLCGIVGFGVMGNGPELSILLLHEDCSHGIS